LRMAKSIIQEKTYAFASRMVKVYKYLTQEQREFVLSKQVLRSGTSIGANVEEALAAGSKADFVYKLTISAKEARGTSYWLRLLHDNGSLPSAAFTSIHQENLEIIKIITSIILTAKNGKSTNSKPKTPNSSAPSSRRRR
jgi:four helix bundle protein